MKAFALRNIFVGGFSLCAACVSARADTITLWVNAFIPSSGPAAITNVPNQPGQTMLNGGVVGCFLTDQRSFSSDNGASARMTSKITFDLDASGGTNISTSQATGLTQRVDCSSGSTDGLCSGQAATDNMSFTNIQFDQNQQILSFTLDGRASNPCFEWQDISIAPNIHYKLYFTFNVNNRGWGITGTLGDFPAFEGYMQVNGNAPVTLFNAGAHEFNAGLGIASDRSPDLEITGMY